MSIPAEITALLADWSAGNEAAFNQLVPLVYDELRRLAHCYMRRERLDHTLQTTALVHEAYLRLVNQRNARWETRAHFFALAAQVMRHILIDYARGRQRAKRGNGEAQLALEEGLLMSKERASELIAVNDALDNLTVIDPRKSKVFELRYFGGMSVEETAEVLKTSPATITRDWKMAKAWLRREIGNEWSATA